MHVVSLAPKASFTSSDKEKIALAMIEAGADINMTDGRGTTALQKWNEYNADATLRYRVSRTVEVCYRNSY